MSDLEREQECEHQWKEVRDWEGDPSIPNGTRTFIYWVCTECGEEDWDNDHTPSSDYEEYDYEGNDDEEPY